MSNRFSGDHDGTRDDSDLAAMDAEIDTIVRENRADRAHRAVQEGILRFGALQN